MANEGKMNGNIPIKYKPNGYGNTNSRQFNQAEGINV